MGNVGSGQITQEEKERLLRKKLDSLTPEQREEYLRMVTPILIGSASSARNSLDAFAKRMLRVDPARHHSLINFELERVERKEIDRLMLFLPPGSAKSTYASWNFPAWYLGRNPTKNIIGTSHTAEFSEHWSRKVRDLFLQPEWPFDGVTLSQESKSVSAWGTNKGGEYFAVGVGGAVTGRRADGAMIDDPIKGRIDADSETVRSRLWEWYLADLHTRLKPGGFIVLIQTRWHEDDLAGRILGPNYRNQSGDWTAVDGRKWRVVCLPQEAEEGDILGRQPGEVLWPEWYRPDHIAAEKLTLGERNFSALHQQRPSPETGTLFKREHIRFYQQVDSFANRRPDDLIVVGQREDGSYIRLDSLRIYGASDYAMTSGSGDFTVHGIGGVDANDDLYLLDWFRKQVNTLNGVEVWADLVGRWRPIQWGEDRAQVERSIEPFVEKRQAELGLYCQRVKLPCTGDKAQRSQSIIGRIAQGKVYFPSNAPWCSDLIYEMMQFDNGKYDDQVDVLSLFGRMLTIMRPQVNQGRTFRVIRGHEDKKRSWAK